MLWLRIIVIGVLTLLSLDATAEEKEKCGLYDGVDLTNDPVLLERILSEHKEWLADSKRREDDPRRANLCGADLTKADLWGADLREANLAGAKLSEANLMGARLISADLEEADLTKANLTEANLTKAYLWGADLTKADLWGADLSEAYLVQTDLTNAILRGVSLFRARFEPSSLPSIDYLTGTLGLKDVRFDDGKQAALVRLRAAIKEAGLRELEREATYAIERGKTSHARGLEKWLKLIFFEWTSGYGLHYGRPLFILLLLLFPFAVVYYFPIAGCGASRLYLVWSDERIEDDAPEGKPERHVEPLVFDPKKNPLRIVGFALYFSLLSAFHIGWRDLNVGNWIARIQPREYSLRAKGWVRTVSGIQSLISIYLLALWVLIYFGRPFG